MSDNNANAALNSLLRENRMGGDHDMYEFLEGLGEGGVTLNLDPIGDLIDPSTQQDTQPKQTTTTGQNRQTAESMVHITPSLAALAQTTKPVELSFSDPSLMIPFEGIDDRGEMGGKRKKQPHERAGWKEMDERAKRPTGTPSGTRGPRKKNAGDISGGEMSGQNIGSPAPTNTGNTTGSNGEYMMQHHHQQQQQQQNGINNQNQDQSRDDTADKVEMAMNNSRIGVGVGVSAGGSSNQNNGSTPLQLPSQVVEEAEDQDHGVDELESALRDDHLGEGVLADVLRSAEAVQHQHQSQTEDQNQMSDSLPMAEGSPGSLPVGRTAKSEQNRRAQQVYRRRREERMKDLEAQAAALEPTRQALFDTYEKTKELAHEYETASIQIAALRQALHNIAESGVSILNEGGALPIDTNGLKDEKMTKVKNDKSAVERALDGLETQSRELARIRRGTSN